MQRIDREYQRGAALESNYFTSGSDSAMYDLEMLYDIADAHCPDYCTFGSHPGDGADLGVWPCEELFHDTSPGGYDGHIVHSDSAPNGRWNHSWRRQRLEDRGLDITHWLHHLNDHGIATMYRLAGSRVQPRWIECWSTGDRTPLDQRVARLWRTAHKRSGDPTRDEEGRRRRAPA